MKSQFEIVFLMHPTLPPLIKIRLSVYLLFISSVKKRNEIFTSRKKQQKILKDEYTPSSCLIFALYRHIAVQQLALASRFSGGFLIYQLEYRKIPGSNTLWGTC